MVLDIVQLGKLPAIVGRDVLLKLFERLAAQVGAVDQEEDAARPTELDEAPGLLDSRWASFPLHTCPNGRLP